MVLQNYVMLTTGVPARMHFADHTIETRQISDPRTGKTKSVNVLLLSVDRLNGAAVNGYYSTMSEKHANQFSAYLAEKTYRNYDFIITRRGEGFQTSWTVQAVPL